VSEPVVHLIRHGAHDLIGKVLCGRDHPIGLNAEGRAQAAAAARRLRDAGVARVFASPAVRTRQTADAVGETLGLVVVEDEALQEIDFGDWAGRSFEALDPDPAWVRWNLDRPESAAPGGETASALAHRVAAWLTRLIAAGETVVAVSHADVIKAIVCRVLGLSLNAWPRFEVSPGSITGIGIGSDAPRLLSLNEAPA
jgi:ribonuclease H / adenosylcobalamin/alpha-ribazole phosphatase